MKKDQNNDKIDLIEQKQTSCHSNLKFRKTGLVVTIALTIVSLVIISTYLFIQNQSLKKQLKPYKQHPQKHVDQLQQIMGLKTIPECESKKLIYEMKRCQDINLVSQESTCLEKLRSRCTSAKQSFSQLSDKSADFEKYMSRLKKITRLSTPYQSRPGRFDMNPDLDHSHGRHQPRKHNPDVLDQPSNGLPLSEEILGPLQSKDSKFHKFIAHASSPVLDQTPKFVQFYRSFKQLKNTSNGRPHSKKSASNKSPHRPIRKPQSINA